VHEAKAPPSSLHSKVEPPSFALKEKLGAVAFDGSLGEASIAVSGGVVSTVHVKVEGVASVLPAASVARTSNVCDPSARPV
jgi:hypothetical protein